MSWPFGRQVDRETLEVESLTGESLHPSADGTAERA